MRKRDQRSSGRKQRKWGAMPLIYILFFSAILISALTAVGVAGYMMLGLPGLNSLKTYTPPAVTEVYDASYRPLAYWYKEKRWPVTLSDVPETLIQSFLAAEDARFYTHPGIDFFGVARAMIKNMEAGAIVQGASTITQQVTRALLLSRERSWIRKLKEAILAWQIDAALTKDEILTIYLNQIYLGNGAYGVEAAARTYFAKHVWDLNLAECAMIAGLPQAPSSYNPARHFKKAVQRQRYVLGRMVSEGYIRQEEMDAALAFKIKIKKETLPDIPEKAYFLVGLRKELEARYGKERLLSDGMTIVTTLDGLWQARAVEAVRQGAARVIARHPEDKGLAKNINGALLSIDAHTGAIKAMVGGLDFDKSQFNMATQGLMQPGSCFKPVVYSTALAMGVLQPDSIIVDEPVTLQGSTENSDDLWKPENFDRKYMGPVTLVTGLTYSRNIIAIKTARLTGVKPIIRQARKMGITVPLAADLSIALGSSAVPLAQLVSAYSTFPNNGKRVKLQYVQSITDRYGNELEALEPETSDALDPVTACQMTFMLKNVVEDGTGRCARKLGVPAGGKTGTTNNCQDAWFMGFTPSIVTGVWIGRMDKKSLGKKETGGRVACPVWRDFMEVTVHGQESFTIPEGVVIVPMDRATGEIADPDDRSRKIVWEAVPEERIPQMKKAGGYNFLDDWIREIGEFFKNL
jgi:penicillin-binding protein 1A